MAREGRNLAGDVLARLSGLSHGRANAKTLARELGLHGVERNALQPVLEALARRGQLIELRSGQYCLPGRTQEYSVGRLNMHRDGYGFVVADVPPPGIRGDVFIPPERAASAMHGDRVVARITRVTHEAKAEGEVVRVLERAHATVVGEFHVGRRENFVVPREARIQQPIVIPEGMELPPQSVNPDRIGAEPRPLRGADDLDGLVVNVEIVDYPEDEHDAAVGRVIEVLGHPDDFGVDVEITIRKFHLPHRFPAPVLEEARHVRDTLSEAECAGRRDFRSLDVVTIDGETARDFDDAVYVARLANGNYALDVHIADVSHYVRPGSAIDGEALNRGTSVYFPDRAVPMLPLELSTGICSLKPGVDRLALSALLEIDHHGDVVAQQFCRSVIRSVERLTYTNVHLLLEGDPAQRERYERLAPRLELMRELALLLNRRRARRGSIDFDLPEPLIVFDPQGVMTGIERAPRNIAHRIIEEFMLAANEAVAAHLAARLPESIYRIHEVPDPGRVLEFEEQAVRFGFTLGMGAMPVKRYAQVDRLRDGRKVRRDIERADPAFRVTSQMYQKLVAKLEGRPEERILNYLMLRSLKQARYATENVGHFALAAPLYTHFTSPIRRYPDLLVHRLLGALLDGRVDTMAGLAEMAGRCSETERRAAEAERELLEWKKARFMAERIGEEFPALVISTGKFGFFVELDALFVEGLVSLDDLPGERWMYQENARKLVAERSRRELKIGDKVTVRLVRVDAVDNRLLFSLVLPETGRRRRK